MSTTMLKVMSFNMKRNYLSLGRNRWENRAALVAQVIRDNDPFILGTQELTSVSLSDMVRLLPDYDYVGQGRGGGDSSEFSAIFYKRESFRVLFDETFWLSNTPDIPSRAWFAPFRRICTTCRLQHLPSGNVLQVYNTHLDHISYFARVNGLRLIIKRMQEHTVSLGYSPVVLMGDFNATPSSKTLRAWERHMLADSPLMTLESSYNMLAKHSPGRSYHGFRGTVDGHPIDYIFTTKDIYPRDVVIRHDAFDSSFPSDHYPVVAELELLPDSVT